MNSNPVTQLNETKKERTYVVLPAHSSYGMRIDTSTEHVAIEYRGRDEGASSAASTLLLMKAQTIHMQLSPGRGK